mgnify:FL=1
MGGINAGGRFNTHTHPPGRYNPGRVLSGPAGPPPPLLSSLVPFLWACVTMCEWAGGGSSDVRRKPVIRDTAVMVVVRAEIETCPTAFFYNNSKSYVSCGTYATGVMEFALSSGIPKFYVSCGIHSTGVRCRGYGCPVSRNLESVWWMLFFKAVLDGTLSPVPQYLWSAFPPSSKMELGLTTFLSNISSILGRSLGLSP